MNFFITQFLHAVPAQMPELYTAVGLALFTAGATRFVLWPIERHTPPAAAPPALPGSGLARPTTRQAFQVTAASALALLAGSCSPKSAGTGRRYCFGGSSSTRLLAAKPWSAVSAGSSEL
ncbi:hypothetical protein [Streptomyces violaceus]|uniref:hypothetical protein n=1 Tax=Streptomyces violaceus TaxID=1936 RepID=UPI003CD0A90A